MREVTLQLTGFSVLHFERPIQQLRIFQHWHVAKKILKFSHNIKSLSIDYLFLTKNVASSANADIVISISPILKPLTEGSFLT